MIIPQLATNIETKIKVLSDVVDPESGEVAILAEDVASPSQTDIVIQNKEDNFVLLKIMENNGAYQKKNFDIEVFEIIEQKEDDVTIETLRPLYFTKAKSSDPFDPLEAVEEVTPADNQDYVAHYFDFLIQEISLYFYIYLLHLRNI